jgi:hypothetical protein
MKRFDGVEREYSYLICSRVPRAFVHDLYALYSLKRIESSGSFIGPVLLLRVEEIIDPEEWLRCVKWTRYRKVGHGDASLEWFIARPKNSAFYYSVGEEGTLLLSKDDDDSIEIHRDTVCMFTKESSDFCHDPILTRINWNDGQNSKSV